MAQYPRYNGEDNRRALKAVGHYELNQGIINKNPKIEELVFAAALQEIQHCL